MKLLSIAKGFSLPIDDMVTGVEVILAKRRAGKSYTMRRIVEQLLKAEQQVVMVDPKGDQWGLRSSADGKKPGFPVLILGGEHGDLPLEVNGGEVVARLVVEERVSVLLDLSQFRKHEIATFMTAFLENLYRLKAQEKYRTPVKLIVDEADAVAPQKPQKGEERMLGAIEDIVRRGGQRGIGCMLVTQRSAVLNKNVLTQAQMLIVLRTIAPQDLAAMKAWIDVHGTPEEAKELMGSLPGLPIGDAWFWNPDGIFERVHVLPIETFDSGATPKPGQKRIIPKNLADVDLDALKGQMAETIEKAKQDDPKALRREITVLKQQLADLGKQKGAYTPEALKKEVDRAVAIAIKRRDEEWVENSGQWKRYAKNLSNIISDVADLLRKRLPDGIPTQPPEKPELKTYGDGVKIMDRPHPGVVHVPAARLPAPIATPAPAPLFDGEVVLKAGARRMLGVLVSRYPMKMTKSQFATLSGMSPKSSTFEQYLSALKRSGLISANEGIYIATEQGIEECGDARPTPQTPDEIRAMWRSNLKAGTARLLDILIANRSVPITKQELALEAGMSMNSSTFEQYVSILKRNGLIEQSPNGLIASSFFF